MILLLVGLLFWGLVFFTTPCPEEAPAAAREE
jgi:hypothetical protein